MSASSRDFLENISEFQLRELFKGRKFSTDLHTTSGKKVEISQIGDANSDAGPDFNHCLVKIDGLTMRGDIEFHKKSSDWYGHSHNSDRNYNGVVLHIVAICDDERLCLTQSGRKIETVEFSRFFSEDAESFLLKLEPSEEIQAIRCNAVNSRMSRKDKLSYLEFLGEKRFLHKVNKLEERLKDIIDENRPVIFEAKQKYFRDFSELLIEH